VFLTSSSDDSTGARGRRDIQSSRSCTLSSPSIANEEDKATLYRTPPQSSHLLQRLPGATSFTAFHYYRLSKPLCPDQQQYWEVHFAVASALGNSPVFHSRSWLLDPPGLSKPGDWEEDVPRATIHTPNSEAETRSGSEDFLLLLWQLKLQNYGPAFSGCMSGDCCDGNEGFETLEVGRRCAAKRLHKWTYSCIGRDRQPSRSRADSRVILRTWDYYCYHL
jgi:hypothetical protein